MCGHTKLIKIEQDVIDEQRQRYKCQNCDQFFLVKPYEITARRGKKP